MMMTLSFWVIGAIALIAFIVLILVAAALLLRR